MRSLIKITWLIAFYALKWTLNAALFAVCLIWRIWCELCVIAGFLFVLYSVFDKKETN